VGGGVTARTGRRPPKCSFRRGGAMSSRCTAKMFSRFSGGGAGSLGHAAISPVQSTRGALCHSTVERERRSGSSTAPQSLRSHRHSERNDLPAPRPHQCALLRAFSGRAVLARLWFFRLFGAICQLGAGQGGQVSDGPFSKRHSCCATKTRNRPCESVSRNATERHCERRVVGKRALPSRYR